jgi:hypothetical protein
MDSTTIHVFDDSAKPGEIIGSSQPAELAQPSPVFTSEQVVQVLFAYFDGLGSEVMSGDIWALVDHKAYKTVVERQGMPAEQFEAIVARIKAARQQLRRGNPMHSMF